MTAKTTAQKLLLKPGAALWCAPEGRVGIVGPLPGGVRVADRPEDATAVLLVVDDAASLRSLLAEHGRHLAGASLAWIAYPKGNRTDVNRDTLWPVVATLGLRPITQVALDETWSALRFRPLRADEPPFQGGA